MWRGWVAGVLVALAVAGPAAAAPRPHIVGGVPAAATPFMASVRITYPFGTVASCGGTLVAARYVVTAGHCVAPDLSLGGAPSRVDVVLGGASADGDPDAERMPGAQIVANPAYAAGPGAPRNDVAVLRLPAPSTHVPARLPRPQDAALWAPGTAAVALGYGLTNANDDGSAAAVLQQVDLPIVADAECQRVYGSSFDAAELCAGGVPGKDTCQGDSGGPLVVADAAGTATLAGVTSYGDGCGSTYGVYTEAGGTVSPFLRSVIPQVELDLPATATAGVPLPLTATGTDPDNGGSYGALAWDLDGNGDYLDATGASATLTPRVGRNVVSVLGTDGAGNRETRTVVVTGERLPARVRVRASRTRVRGGRFAVAVSPNQAGTVTVTTRRGARRLARTASVRTAAAGTRRVTVRLTGAARRTLRARGRLRVVVRATLKPSLGGPAQTARRTLSLR